LRECSSLFNLPNVVWDGCIWQASKKKIRDSFKDTITDVPTTASSDVPTFSIRFGM
jgi:hypothetical protein